MIPLDALLLKVEKKRLIENLGAMYGRIFFEVYGKTTDQIVELINFIEARYPEYIITLEATEKRGGYQGVKIHIVPSDIKTHETQNPLDAGMFYAPYVPLQMFKIGDIVDIGGKQSEITAVDKNVITFKCIKHD